MSVLDESGEGRRHKVPIFTTDSGWYPADGAEIELKFALSVGGKM